MAYSNIIKNGVDYLAEGDLSAEQYTFMKRGTGMTTVQAGAGEAALGVLWNAPAAAGRPAVLIVDGRPHVYAAEAITDGDEIASDANGEAAVAVSTDVVVGIALHDAVDGELVQIDFLSGDAQYTKA